jgi:hypothetical protein
VVAVTDDYEDVADGAPSECIYSVRAADVKLRRVEWLWDGWIPRGKISVLDGNPGLAKSTITLYLAARITTGRAMPDGAAGISGAVVVVSYEDDPADTIVPRFLTAGGDGSRMHLANVVKTADSVEPFELPDHVPHLEALTISTGAVLVVIDPLMAALAGDVKSGIDHDVRRALAPLKSMAERTGAAVLVVRHLNKSAKVTDPLLRGGGSIGIIGAARAGLIVGRDPDDPSRRVLALSKSNLAPDTRPSLAYCVETDAEYDVGRLRWLGTCDQTARDLLDADQEPTGAVGEAASVLRELLEEGPQLATEAKSYCNDAGISGRTLDRAKKSLGVQARPRVNGDGRTWWWSLPTEERQGGRL